MPLKLKPWWVNGFATLSSIAGLCRRFSIVPGEARSANPSSPSLNTVIEPFGDRLGVPHGRGVAELDLGDDALHLLGQDTHDFLLNSFTHACPVATLWPFLKPHRKAR